MCVPMKTVPSEQLLQVPTSIATPTTETHTHDLCFIIWNAYVLYNMDQQVAIQSVRHWVFGEVYQACIVPVSISSYFISLDLKLYSLIVLN